jgi:hypothetical protein
MNLCPHEAGNGPMRNEQPRKPLGARRLSEEEA